MLPEAMTLQLIRSAPHRYKVYKIDKKKSGEKRTIAQPSRQVKALQYWAIEKILKGLPVHPAAMAYRKRRSIRDNAARHAPQKYLLKLDFQNFFPSIRAGDLEAYFSLNNVSGLTDEDVFLLQRLLFWNPKRTKKLVMSIGAPSSPILSNILLYGFDRKVQAICSKEKVKYTRYADDLTFSTDRPNVLRDIEPQIRQICNAMKHPKLKLKDEKTVHASRRGARKVTGLVLSNDGEPSLGRDRKRLIRAQVHHFLSGKMNIDDAMKLRGMLAFANSSEPDFLQRLRDHYGDGAISRIMSLGTSSAN
jgi:hypothetical protein